mmetsp:Transcript_11439/g.26953  ORF Transcript_11439/g.26953 Transcript_11439/m.26953 type:complete len:239 (-) Transcript_11439:551-1267(-)
MQRLLRLAVLRWGHSIALHHHDISGVRTIWDPCAGGHDCCLRRCDEHCAFCGNGACGSQCAGINRRVGVRFHPCHSGRHIYNNRRFGSSRNAPQSLPAHGRLPIKTRREGGGRGKTSGMAEFLGTRLPHPCQLFHQYGHCVDCCRICLRRTECRGGRSDGFLYPLSISQEWLRLMGHRTFGRRPKQCHHHDVYRPICDGRLFGHYSADVGPCCAYSVGCHHPLHNCERPVSARSESPC